jgi:hypothetical protein
MTVQKLHLDLIEFRKGQIDLDELRRRFSSWAVSRDYARFCVEHAKATPIRKRQTGDLFA